MKRLPWALLFVLALSGPLSGLTEAAKREPKNPKEDVEAIGNRDVGKGANFYSIEKEIALGRQLAQEVERQAKIVDDPVLAEYVNRVGQNLVRNSDARVPFTIKVIDNEEVNAFALPGGFFFVHTGLIRLAGSEAELAGVMAHEIAHVTARHGTRQATRGQITNLASIPLIFLGGGIGVAARQAAGLAVPLTFLKFSRNFEREADFLGVQYLYKAGYDPAAMVAFFERIQAQEKNKPGSLAKIFRSHPLTENRIARVQKAIDELLPDRPEYVVDTSEFAQMKTQLAQLHAAGGKQDNDPKRPTLRRNPSGSTVPAEDNGQASEAEKDERPRLTRR